ncbi:TPA: hypothetical protein TXL51_001166 [Streptococcus suis]|nr:hypothetical protein [Streptococcus suis]
MATIDERLNTIKLKESQMAIIKKDVRLKQLSDGGGALASLVTGGISDIFRPLLDVNADIEQGIRETKQTLLIEHYLNKIDDMSQSFEELKNMIGDTYGNHLFNRLLWILDRFPPEEAYISLVSDILNKFIDRGHYQKLFGSYQLHLRMLERLSPQGVYLLRHYKELPPFKKSGYATHLNSETGEMELQGDWGRDVIRYARLDELIIPVVSELIDDHYLVAVADRKSGMFIPTLTESGKTLFSYLS